ncbi:MAG: hypothetical protein FJ096_21885, partial [Deltaproteobacteria bacterium]|nr:hypothetical protein [Deltaproteobacteria bacterium]
MGRSALLALITASTVVGCNLLGGPDYRIEEDFYGVGGKEPASDGVTVPSASGSGGTATSGGETLAASSNAASTVASSGTGSSCEPSVCQMQDLPGDCYFASCQGATCEVSLVSAKGTKCATNGGKLCDDTGTCVGCLGTSDCSDLPNTMCVGGFCQKEACANGIQDGKETGVDCGGPTCARCGNGAGCLLPSDCQTNLWLASVLVCSPCSLKLDKTP